MPSRLKMRQKRKRCPKCDAKNGYMRNHVDCDYKEWVCRACGAETLMEEISYGLEPVQETE